RPARDLVRAVDLAQPPADGRELPLHECGQLGLGDRRGRLLFPEFFDLHAPPSRSPAVSGPSGARAPAATASPGRPPCPPADADPEAPAASAILAAASSTASRIFV